MIYLCTLTLFYSFQMQRSKSTPINVYSTQYACQYTLNYPCKYKRLQGSSNTCMKRMVYHVSSEFALTT